MKYTLEVEFECEEDPQAVAFTRGIQDVVDEATCVLPNRTVLKPGNWRRRRAATSSVCRDVV